MLHYEISNPTRIYFIFMKAIDFTFKSEEIRL